MKRGLRKAFLAAALMVAVLYLGDYAILRFRIATNRQPYGTVTVTPYYAVPQKDHRIEFLADSPQDETCVNSLFPHQGDSPCWYLTRHKDKRINM